MTDQTAAETLQERIKRALASEGLELDETASASANGRPMFFVREKWRDRGCEIAERLVEFTEGFIRFYDTVTKHSTPLNCSISPEMQIRAVRKSVASAINASNAELIREVLEILKFHGYEAYNSVMCTKIAALSPETKI
jgi:predicted ArsR family transcriptional regulator